MLQVALDHTSLPAALRDLVRLDGQVDVVEAGTILCFAEGMQAVRAVRAVCPEKTVVADLKAADAGSILAEGVFEAGADWMTVICNAPAATKRKAQQVAAKRGGEIQIELYGHWTFEDAAEWREMGIRQAIYHRGRDAEAAGQQWGDADLRRIAQLAEMGIEVSVTGGLGIDTLGIFQGIPVKVFIAGRSLCSAEDPAGNARAFKDEIARLFG
jgi:3-dehydro-L-gulonate-6-phosphate decarboxylase